MRFLNRHLAAAVAVTAANLLAPATAATGSPELAGTQPLTLQGDISEAMIAGVDRFLLRETEVSVQARAGHWRRDVSSVVAYAASIEPNRVRLARLIGLREARLKFADIELVATPSQPALVGKGNGFDVYAVRWPVFEGVNGEGLWLEPTGREPWARVVVVPDCEQTPEALVGLSAGIPAESQIARRLAESGCRVIVPGLAGCVTSIIRTSSPMSLMWLAR